MRRPPRRRRACSRWPASAPWLRTNSWLRGPVVAIERAPASLASCSAKCPTPPEPFKSKSVAPEAIPALRQRLLGGQRRARDRGGLLEQQARRHERDVALGDGDVLGIGSPLDVRLPRVRENAVALCETAGTLRPARPPRRPRPTLRSAEAVRNLREAPSRIFQSTGLTPAARVRTRTSPRAARRARQIGDGEALRSAERVDRDRSHVPPPQPQLV